MADIAHQRKNMVESQIRPSDITDRRIIRAMLETPREQFVPTDLKPLAYMDDEIALTKSAPGVEARALLAPRTLAKMVQLAQIGSRPLRVFTSERAFSNCSIAAWLSPSKRSRSDSML